MMPEYWSLLRTLQLPGETTTLAEHAERWAQAMLPQATVRRTAA